jgi:hypothetical protein
VTWSGNAAADRELNRTYLDGMKRISQLRSCLANNLSEARTSYYATGTARCARRGNTKGTLSNERHRKPSTETREQARRINNLPLGVVAAG